MSKTETAVLSDADKLAAKEKDIRKAYKRVVPGSIQKETDGPHAGKITVEIECAARGCKEIRRVATSDLFQVEFCTVCTKLLRNKKRKAARKGGEDAAVKVVAKKAKPAGDDTPAVKTKPRKIGKKRPAPDALQTAATGIAPVEAAAPEPDVAAELANETAAAV